MSSPEPSNPEPSSLEGPPGVADAAAAEPARLEPVPGVTSDETPRAKQPLAGSEADQARRGVPMGLVLGLGLILAGIIAWQFLNARALEGRVAGLESELARKSALLSAHRENLGEIRGGVSELEAQLQQLRGLVEVDPERSVRIPARP